MTDMTREEALRNARMADLLYRPISDVAFAAIEHIRSLTVTVEAQEKLRDRKRTAQALENFEATMGALLADLLLASTNENSQGYCYRSSNRDKFKATVAESRPYEALKKIWVNMGLIDVVPGFRGTDDFDGESYHPDTPSFNWATRLRATDALLDILKGFEMSADNISQHFKKDHSKTSPIVLRAKKKPRQRKSEDMEYVSNSRTTKWNSEIIEINEFLSKHTFNFEPQPSFQRLFNNGDQPGFDWNEGGRFYILGNASYIEWPSDVRLTIEIDGEPVSDVDIANCQLTLVHGILGYDFDLNRDAYSIEGIPRDAVKKVVNTTIGMGKIPQRAPQNFFSDLDFEVKPKFAELRDRVLEQLPVLNEVDRKSITSTHLQFVESEIIKNTMLTLKRNFETPSLPVHDCLIVQSKNIELAADMLTHHFQQEVGLKPRLSIS